MEAFPLHTSFHPYLGIPGPLSPPHLSSPSFSSPRHPSPSCYVASTLYSSPSTSLFLLSFFLSFPPSSSLPPVLFSVILPLSRSPFFTRLSPFLFTRLSLVPCILLLLPLDLSFVSPSSFLPPPFTLLRHSPPLPFTLLLYSLSLPLHPSLSCSLHPSPSCSLFLLFLFLSFPLLLLPPPLTLLRHSPPILFTLLHSLSRPLHPSLSRSLHPSPSFPRLLLPLSSHCPLSTSFSFLSPSSPSSSLSDFSPISHLCPLLVLSLSSRQINGRYPQKQTPLK